MTQTQLNPHYQHLIVFALGLLLPAGIGLSYAMGNQNTYLIDGLRQIDPSLWQYDWFATQTSHYHDNFAWILLLLSKLSSLPLATAIFNGLLMILSVFALFSLLKQQLPQKALLALTALVGLMVLTQTASVATSYIYSPYLQPSSIAAAFLIFAIVSFCHRHYGLSGLSLALAGIFHTNFLILGIGAFGFAHLLQSKGQLSKPFFTHCTMNLAPSLAYLLYLLPMLLAMSGSEYGAQAREIYQTIRSPHHYIPMTFLADFIKFAGVQLMAVTLIYQASQSTKSLQPLHFIYLSMLIMVVVATLLTTVVFVPLVSQLFFWRLAPFVSLLAMVLIITALLNHGAGLIYQRPVNGFNLGLSCLASYYLHKLGLPYPLTITAAVAGVVVLVFMLKQPLSSKFSISLPLTAVLLLAICIIRVPNAYQQSNIFTDTTPAAKQALFAWIKQNTSSPSQFLVSPGFTDFRLKSQRAIVVDWKSPPIMPAQVMQWYQRVMDVSGQTNVKTPQQAKHGYQQLDQARLKMLKARYNIDYAVFSRAKANAETLGEIIYQNNKYVIIVIS